MKIHKVFLFILLSFVNYAWLYEYKLGDIFYDWYQPGYDKEVVFPTFNLDGTVASNPDNYKLDGPWGYLPLHAKFLKILYTTSILTLPFIYITSLILFLTTTIRNKLYFNFFWWLINFIIYGFVIIVVFNFILIME